MGSLARLPPTPMEHANPSPTKAPTKKEWWGFYSLIFIQSQNAFNEKAAQFLLIPLGVWLATTFPEYGPDSWVNSLQYSLACVFVLPYILFAPIVGWLADCFCKARVIQVMSFLQILVLLAMYFCYKYHNIELAVFWFCVFSVQATILSPAKKGVVKDMVGSKSLGYASGLLEMSLILSMLVAQIGIFAWFNVLQVESNDGWEAAAFPTLILTALAVPVALASMYLPKYPSVQTRKFQMSLFYEHFVQLKYLWSQRELKLSEIGVSYFWFLAGALMLISLQIAQEFPLQDAGFSMSAAILMSWLSGGTVIGGVIGSVICRKKIELGLIPLGAIGFTLGCVFMAFFAPGTLPSNIGFGLTGAFAAMYLVPLNAYLQDKCDPSNRSTVIAAGNLMDCLMGLVAVGAQLLMRQYFSIQNQFWILAVLGVGITFVAFRLIPREFLRMMGLWIIRLVYRARIVHQGRIPEEGGALIIANHVTYADALFLSLICPRPIRFIVAEEIVAIRWLGWILEMFNCLPISSRNPREALSRAIKAIRDGEIICIFPEGQLTRTGTLCAARRGFELLARKSHAPVIPIYMDELWGSLFSYAGNRFFSKKPKQFPYRITAAIGQALEPENVSPPVVINTLRELSSECVEIASSIGRDAVFACLERVGKKTLVFAKSGKLTGQEIAACLMNDAVNDEISHKHAELRCWLEQLLECTRSQSRLCKFWMNAQQLTRVNALQPGELLLTGVGNNEVHETVVAILWPILTGTPVYLLSTHDKHIPKGGKQIAGAAAVRKMLYHLVPAARTPFYDFSSGGDFVAPNIGWRPCFATDSGIVLAMSMRHSVFKLDDGTVQLGMRARTRGKLLPGFYLNPLGSATLCGATLDPPYNLPPKLYLDESGFLAELQA